MVASICIYTRERGKNTGLQPDVIEKQAAHIKTLLGQISDEQLDDFTHGILGNIKMKKDTLVTLTANQKNSSGAVQQVGAGSQQSATVNYQNLVNAIDSIVGSAEYAALTPEQKVAFDDMHSTGIFDWDYLLDLGRNHATYWQDYVDEPAQKNLSREPVVLRQ